MKIGAYQGLGAKRSSWVQCIKHQPAGLDSIRTLFIRARSGPGRLEVDSAHLHDHFIDLQGWRDCFTAGKICCGGKKP